MSTLYIRLPAHTTVDSLPSADAASCPFTLVSDAGAIEHEGVSTLAALSAQLGKARRVVLLLAASDVTLLRVKVPPMSAARLKSALPNLVEDQLMSDPAECVMVAGAVSDGLRTIAVVQRRWLQTLATTLAALGARHIVAMPAQLCLPYQAGTVSAAIAEQDSAVDLTLRLSPYEGIGLPVSAETATAAQEVTAALRMLVPTAPVTLYVPQASVPAYQEFADPALTVAVDQWSHWIAGAKGLTLDLMSALSARSGPALDWQRWRWPLALAAIAVTLNVIGLNVEWWRLRHEADGLRAAMLQTFKAAFPKENVIVDPLVQMRQKIAAAQRDSGQLGPNDFAALLARFGEVWSQVAQQRNTALPSIAGVEYKEQALLVRLKADGEAPAEEVKAALATRNLALTQPVAGVWQIRSTK